VLIKTASLARLLFCVSESFPSLILELYFIAQCAVQSSSLLPCPSGVPGNGHAGMESTCGTCHHCIPGKSQ
jgi:hypothetical protein